MKATVESQPANRPSPWMLHFIQYMFVGAVSAAVDLSVFQAIREFVEIGGHITVFGHGFEAEYTVAKICSFAIGTTINFFLCVLFVFNLRGRSLATASWRKLVSGIVALAVNLAVLITLVEAVHLGEISDLPVIPFDGVFLANAFAIGIGFLVNFVLTKYYAFGDY
ncbi:MAG: GtrA family protein [Candidatus Dadabacteria bacterium]|nr:GtrA family protein [Candidatus Dadabacteria bacterium]